MNNLGRLLHKSNAITVMQGRPRLRDRLADWSIWLAEKWMAGWLLVLILNILFIVWAVPQLNATMDLVMDRCLP